MIEHLDGFFADFGVDCTVAGASVRCILDTPYADAVGALVSGAQVVLTCPSAEVSSAARGASVTVGAQGYTIASIEPDGTGMTRLGLLKA